MSLAESYRCRTHPDREGIGVCVRCRRVVCAECSTKVDRMNFCTSCLAALTADPARRRSSAAGSPAAGIAALLAGFGALVVLFLLAGFLLATFLRA